jgi:hypothetical protein
MRFCQKALDVTENRKRASRHLKKAPDLHVITNIDMFCNCRGRFLMLRDPPLRISQHQKAASTVTKHVDVSNNM